MSSPACPACGTWECITCGWQRQKANRYGRQLCRKCSSPVGIMHSVYHMQNLPYRLSLYVIHTEFSESTNLQILYPLRPSNYQGRHKKKGSNTNV